MFNPLQNFWIVLTFGCFVRPLISSEMVAWFNPPFRMTWWMVILRSAASSFIRSMIASFNSICSPHDLSTLLSPYSLWNLLFLYPTTISWNRSIRHEPPRFPSRCMFLLPSYVVHSVFVQSNADFSP